MTPTTSAKISLLDHGYCELVETWGSDQSIIEAARMSTNKGFLGWGPIRTYTCPVHGVIEAYHVSERYRGYRGDGSRESVHMNCMGPGADSVCEVTTNPGDEKLLKYLYENKHSTPFEMAGLTIEVQAPIFVFREWHRHRVPFGYNEMSARYTPLPDLNYVPTVERLMMGGGHLTKQAGTIKDAKALTEGVAREYQDSLRSMYENQEALYQNALMAGVSKELARIHLPVGRYSRMRATANLRGWLGFLILRMAPNAQYEIRVYAEAVGSFIEKSFPRTWELFAGR